jgi:hypothetical protein
MVNAATTELLSFTCYRLNNLSEFRLSAVLGDFTPPQHAIAVSQQSLVILPPRPMNSKCSARMRTHVGFPLDL